MCSLNDRNIEYMLNYILKNVFTSNSKGFVHRLVCNAYGCDWLSTQTTYNKQTKLKSIYNLYLKHYTFNFIF